ncbi:hypothetical protein DH2020_047248 [Rehmannia glutinosa]|uniref:Pectate lyase n=1 Tax=Rehmannia glutinosa TaxID=99300 RepID=A0ABR0U9I6_REHGL
MPMSSSNHTISTFLLCILSFVALVPKSHAAIAEYDDYLLKRAEESYEESLKAFDPNPEKLADELNEQVGELKAPQTRRLQGHKPHRPVLALRPNWAKNRKSLAECARGFGHHTTGGKDGKFYVVTDPSDDDMDKPKPGTIRHAVIQPQPLWIIFNHSMVIKLKEELIFASDKTIDGRGVQVHIAGRGCSHRITHLASDGDAISVFSSNNIWIDHVSLSKASDGLIDVIEGSTAVTISNCKFNHHDAVMLLGAHDSDTKDSIMQVTVAFNRFGEGLVQRMPRCRWGFFHVINNVYSKWRMYAIGGSAHPTIISQGNRFKASNNPNTKQVTKREATENEWKKWQWRSEGDKFVNGAYFSESGPKIKHTRNPFTKKNFIKFRPGSYAGRLTRYAGALKCRAGKLC